MSKKGYYIGGHTVVTKGSSWFSGGTRHDLWEKQLDEEGRRRLLERPIASTPIPGERERTRERSRMKVSRRKKRSKRR